MKLSLGYITCANQSEARNITLLLLEEGLIACANILPQAESYYWWEDGIQKATEYVVIIKTKTKNESPITRCIKQHHSYECPSILFVNIDYGSKDFLRWIDDNC